MNYRYEYNAIKSFLQNNYRNGIDYLLIPIENIWVKLDAKTMLNNGKNRLDLESVEKIYLIDLGKITLTTLQYRIYLLKYFEDLGIKVINSPETILLCRNKIATYLALKKYNLPVIPTIALPSYTDYQVWYDHIKKLGRYVISKPLLGSRGIGIEYLSIDQINKLKKKLDKEEILLIQRFIQTKNICDMRALVVGKEVLSAMKRCAQKGKILTNVFQGGKPYPIKLSENVKSLASKAAKSVNGEIVTVDFIEDKNTNEIFVLEINGFARWEGMQRVVDFNITEKIVKYIMGRYHENI